MPVVHLVLGLAMLALSAVMITRRRSLPLRKVPARNPTNSPTLWIYLGVLFGLNGLVQLVLAVA